MNAALFEETAEAVESTGGSKTIDWSAVWHTVLNWLTSTGIKVVIALVLLVVSFIVINAVTKKIYKRLEKKKADLTLSRVGTSTARVLLKLLVIVSLIGYVGIETASISAVIASIGVGISLAVQGTLSNFAGGVIIIVMRPFKIGDYITSNDVEGTVEDIKLFYTHICTPDNKGIVIPNGALANNVIVNTSAKDTRRVDIVASVAYGTDIALAKEVLIKTCSENELVFKTPAPFVELKDMSESSLDFTVRSWCNRGDYWTVKFALNAAIMEAFKKHGIEVPFNQLDVHLRDVPALPEQSGKEAPAKKEASAKSDAPAQEKKGK